MKITELQPDKKYSRKAWKSWGEDYYIICDSLTDEIVSQEGFEKCLEYKDIIADDWYLVEEDKDRLEEAIKLIKNIYESTMLNPHFISGYHDQMQGFLQKCEVKNEDN